MKNLFFFLILILILLSCKEENKKDTSLFVLKDSSIGISFENTLTYTESFNPYIYRNFYNGGGVAIGDINNDGLEDIYFTGNMVDNKLYLNKGNWQFEDITLKAQVSCPDVWSTGVTFVDINGDGFLDIYVCKSGKPGGSNRHNELFINNGDLTFTESSKEYGLDVEGLSIHAAFFDYDKDGDLDCYILNNSIKSIGAYDLIKDQRTIPDETGGGNKFFRNDNGKFTDITVEAGIYTSKIGFGLGITLGDFNNDDWTDIFISNDFFEKDYLYINDTKGGFKEQLEDYFESISMGSMGADLADLDNDLRTDLLVTEMLPATHERQKTKTIFASWDKQELAKRQGYFNQFSRNTLQRNLGNGSFMELGRKANVSATEWSWSALIFDMDNDGLKDIFISNGIYKDLLDRDYLTYEANDETIKNRINSNEKEVIKKLIDAMPSSAVPNAIFRNLDNFNFENKSKDWGLNLPSFSNGSAYGDLDNDGDLDIVVNNVNMPSFIYENTTDTLTHRSITLKLSQKGKNPNGIGAKVIIKYGNETMAYVENYTSRGFQSSVSSKVHFGLGNTKKIDSLWLKWPDGSTTVLTNLPTNKTYTIEQPTKGDSIYKRLNYITEKSITGNVNPLFNFKHKENIYIDFNNERLLTQMYSNEGPAFASEDINGDGKVDFFVGGAKNQSGKLFISSEKGYDEISTPFADEINSEDVDAIFFDGDNDGDMDLYVCHGGKAFSPYSIALNDSYYINENNTFTKAKNSPSFPITISSSVVKAADYDNDGDLDLFVGERFKTNTYGLPGSGYILVNDGQGNFKPSKNNILQDIGMITDASWTDINNDGWMDLIVLGEWMPIKIYINFNSKLVDKSDSYNLTNTSGLWTSMELIDVDGDGDQDIVAGNIGLNNFFEADMRMYVSDFDNNGFKEQIICKKGVDGYYPIVDKDELISQIPSLKKKLLYYKDYAKSNMKSIFSEKVLNSAYFLDLKILESSVFFNENGIFDREELPNEIQYAPVYTISSTDLNGDGYMDLFFGGNQYLVKPQFGSYDASKGWALFGPFLSKKEKHKVFSLDIKGQIRNLKWVNYNQKKILIALINNENTVFKTFIE
ncbi:MAG: VCBS repeat-containing protein [Flavobacteriaceae bacterium]|nr:VCBS repeat-containing protein [Flavobacteriaceae bacterium]